MAEIVGTITNLSDFLSKTQVCLSVKPNDPQQQIICLEADRKYSIPAFQREVRWDDNNLKMLLYDLSRSSKFLGNIILTIKSDHTCEIIDGQQRTTVLMLQYISNNDTLLSEDGIKTLNAYALKGYRLITDYPLFDKPTSREEFLDAFNVAMQFYEKKDS